MIDAFVREYDESTLLNCAKQSVWNLSLSRANTDGQLLYGGMLAMVLFWLDNFWTVLNMNWFWFEMNTSLLKPVLFP